MKFLQVMAIFFLIAINPLVAAAQLQPLQLQKTDRVLIFAPHPDDETIGTGGIIQEAVRLGIPLRIVYFTHGDSNRLSFLTYKKRPILSKTGLLMMGEHRREEAIAATTLLGARKDQLVFLGYPDLGTFRIFTQYWGSPSAFTSGFAKIMRVPYEDTFSPRALYVAENVLNDIKSTLTGFRPTKIFATLPVDRNGDHCALALFLQIALWDLQKTIIHPPEVYSYLVHASGWPHPRGFHPSALLSPPAQLQDAPIQWWTFALTPEQVEKKKEAVLRYESQISYSRSYLLSFARQNELFGRYEDIILKEDGQGPEDDEQQPVVLEEDEAAQAKKSYLKSASYHRRGNDLLIKIRSSRVNNERIKVNVHLLSYRRDTPFSQLPKIRIEIRKGKIGLVREKRSLISIPHLELEQKRGMWEVRIPLARLGNPDDLLSSVTAGRINAHRERTPWRVIRLLE